MEPQQEGLVAIIQLGAIISLFPCMVPLGSSLTPAALHAHWQVNGAAGLPGRLHVGQVQCLPHLVNFWCQSSNLPILLTEINVETVEFIPTILAERWTAKFVLAAEEDLAQPQEANVQDVLDLIQGRHNKLTHPMFEMKDHDISKNRSISEFGGADMSSFEKFQSVLDSLNPLLYKEGKYSKFDEAKLTITDGKYSPVIMSMPDGACFMHALLFTLGMATEANRQFIFEFNAIMVALNGDVLGGITKAQAFSFGQVFGIPVMSTRSFYEQFASVELSKFAVGGHAGIDSHYSILVADDHAYIIFDSRAKGVTRYSTALPNASSQVLDSDEFAAAIAKVRVGSVEVPFKKRPKKPKTTKSAAAAKALALYNSVVPSVKLENLPSHACCATADLAYRWVVAHKFGVHEGIPFDKEMICCQQSYTAYACHAPGFFPKLFKKHVLPLDTPLEQINRFEATGANIRGRRHTVSDTRDGVILETGVSEERPPQRRLINGNALAVLGADTIVALHNDEPPVNYRENKVSYKPHFSVLADHDHVKLIPNLRGHSLPQAAIQVLQTFSIPIDLAQNRAPAQATSAHSFMRFFQDTMQASMIERTFAVGDHSLKRLIYRPVAGNELEQVQDIAYQPLNVVIDVGAKFTSMINTLRKINPRYSPPKIKGFSNYVPDAQARGVQLNQQQFDAFLFIQATADPGQIYTALWYRTQFVPARDLLAASVLAESPDFSSDLHKLSDFLLFKASAPRFTPIFYNAVRPDVEEYDRTYWNESGVEHRSLRFYSPNVIAQFFKGTLQEYEADEETELINLEIHPSTAWMFDQNDPDHFECEAPAVFLDSVYNGTFALRRRILTSFFDIKEVPNRNLIRHVSGLEGEVLFSTTAGNDFYVSKVLYNLALTLAGARTGRTKRTMWFFDSHYYFPEDYKVADGPVQTMVATTGGNFEPQPGRYYLPLHEGYYTVTASDGGRAASPAKLTMLTRGSGNSYSHPIVEYSDPAMFFPLGWYTFFADFTNSQDFCNKRKQVLTINTEAASPMDEFMLNYLDRVQRESGVKAKTSAFFSKIRERYIRDSAVDFQGAIRDCIGHTHGDQQQLAVLLPSLRKFVTADNPALYKIRTLRGSYQNVLLETSAGYQKLKDDVFSDHLISNSAKEDMTAAWFAWEMFCYYLGLVIFYFYSPQVGVESSWALCTHLVGILYIFFSLSLGCPNSPDPFTLAKRTLVAPRSWVAAADYYNPFRNPLTKPSLAGIPFTYALVKSHMVIPACIHVLLIHYLAGNHILTFVLFLCVLGRMPRSSSCSYTVSDTLVTIDYISDRKVEGYVGDFETQARELDIDFHSAIPAPDPRQIIRGQNSKTFPTRVKRSLKPTYESEFPALPGDSLIRGKYRFGHQEDWVEETTFAKREKVLPMSAPKDLPEVPYYCVKPIAPPPTISGFIDGDRTSQNRIQLLHDYASDNAGMAVDAKCRLFPYSSASKEVVQSGFDLVPCGRFCGGQGSLRSFEWDKRPVENVYAGTRRHLNNNTQPLHLAQFRRFAKREVKALVSRMEFPQVESFKEYPPRAFKDEPAKMKKYLELIPQSLRDGIFEKGPYVAMVKTGEVYVTDSPQDSFYLDHDSRPREIKNPVGIGYTVHAAVQHQLFAAIKNAEPAFIHSMTTEQVAERFSVYGITAHAASFDGSAWDSTQFAQLKDSVEGEFFRQIRPWLVDVFSHPDNQYSGFSPEDAADNYILAACQTTQISYVHLPMVSPDGDATWSQEEKRQFYKYVTKGGDNDPRNFLPFTLHGTTFSGDPHTTIGNTLRNILYMRYYLRDLVGDFSVFAAGDDGVVVCRHEGVAKAASQKIFARTGRGPEDISELGQVVKSVSVGTLDTVEFCSKWFFITPQGLVLTRDYVKTLTTKQFYSRRNAFILRSPGLHRLAIYLGVKSEESSRLLEEIVFASYPEDFDATQVALVQNYLDSQYSPTPVGYAAEDQVNFKLGLSLLDLIRVIRRNKFVCGTKSSELGAWEYQIMQSHFRADPTSPSFNQVADSWQMMNAAKTAPGTIDSPYVNGMNMASNQTGLVSSEVTRTKCTTFGPVSNTVPIGQDDFVCIFYSPCLSYTTGPSGFGNARLSGCYILSSNLLSDQVAGIGNFSNPFFGLTCADLYGSDASAIAPQIFVWASDLTMTLEAPEATKAGAVHFGMFPIGSLGNTGTYSLQQLRASTFKTIDLKTTTTFGLQCAVVDHGIVGKSKALAVNAGQEFGSEMVAYCIIEKAFVNLTTGTNVPFGLAMKVRSNYAFYPNVVDPFVRSLAYKTAITTQLVALLARSEGDVKHEDVVNVLRAGGIDYDAFHGLMNGKPLIRGRQRRAAKSGNPQALTVAHNAPVVTKPSGPKKNRGNNNRPQTARQPNVAKHFRYTKKEGLIPLNPTGQSHDTRRPMTALKKPSVLKKLLGGAAGIILPAPLANLANMALDAFVDAREEEPMISVSTERARLNALLTLIEQSSMPMDRYGISEGSLDVMRRDVRTLTDTQEDFIPVSRFQGQRASSASRGKNLIS